MANSLTGHAVSLMGHISAMYKAIIKPARNTNGLQQATNSQLLAEVMCNLRLQMDRGQSHARLKV